MAVSWRVLNIDGFVEGGEAWRIVRQVYGPAIPLRLYWMLQERQYRRVIRGFTLTR